MVETHTRQFIGGPRHGEVFDAHVGNIVHVEDRPAQAAWRRLDDIRPSQREGTPPLFVYTTVCVTFPGGVSRKYLVPQEWAKLGEGECGKRMAETIEAVLATGYIDG